MALTSVAVVANRLTRSEFARNALTLTAGTAGAQLIMIGTSPILSRIYGATDFGAFSLYFAVVTVVSMGITGKYEAAILLPSADEDGMRLTGLTVLVTLMFTLLLSALLIVVWYCASSVAQDADGWKWFWLLPISFLLQGLYQAQYYWCNRKRHYSQMAVSKMGQVICLVLTSIVLGFTYAGPAGLILGFIVGQGVAVILLMSSTIKDWVRIARVSTTGLRQQAWRYRDFPIFSIPADILNALTSQSPVFLMSFFFGPAVVGFFGMTQRVLSAPVSFVGKAFQDVFRERASRELLNSGDCSKLFVKMAKTLTLLGIGPFLVIQLGAPAIFAWVFGSQWEEAGRFAQIMAVLLLLRFVVTPLSNVLIIAEKQRYNLVWQAGLLILTVGSVLIGVAAASPTVSIVLYTASYSAMYVVCFFMSYAFTRPEASTVPAPVTSAKYIDAAWDCPCTRN